MGLNYEGWIKGTRASYGNDPAEWDGNNTTCKLCDKDAENMDEYCEDHQRCIMCGDNDDCKCEEKWDNKSDCCEATIKTIEDEIVCCSCNKTSSTVWIIETNKCKN